MFSSIFSSEIMFFLTLFEIDYRTSSEKGSTLDYKEKLEAMLFLSPLCYLCILLCEISYFVSSH